MIAARRGGSVGCPYARGRRAAARAPRARRRRLPAAARAPARLHARADAPIPRTCSSTRRRSAPSSCTPTAAATSPTTAPVSSSATRSSRCAEWRDGQRDVVAYVRRARRRADRGARRVRHRRRTASRGSPACGSATRRSPRSACGSRGAAPGTGSRSTSIPTSRCSTTSCRAGSATAGVTSMAALLGARARDARGRRRAWSPSSPRASSARRQRRAPGRRVARASRRPERVHAAAMTGDATRPATHRCGCSAAWPRPGCAIGRRPGARRPEWMQVRADLGASYREPKRLVRELDLHTVCEEAGCPNIYECWADRTATFMILGDRCTRACGFCLVDTRKPLAARPRRAARGSPTRSRTLGLEHAVITSVARDDLADGGAAGVRGDDRRGPRREPRRPRSRC